MFTLFNLSMFTSLNGFQWIDHWVEYQVNSELRSTTILLKVTWKKNWWYSTPMLLVYFILTPSYCLLVHDILINNDNTGTNGATPLVLNKKKRIRGISLSNTFVSFSVHLYLPNILYWCLGSGTEVTKILNTRINYKGSLSHVICKWQ